MLKLFLVILILVAIALALICVRLFVGKKFVHTHIDGNRALNKQGIHCAQSQDRQMRRERRTAVKEHRN
jgi:hypothetical protein